MSLKDQLIQAQHMFAETPIPTMPKEVIELNHAFEKEEFPDLNQLSELISPNMTLVAEIIKLANQKQFLSPRRTQVLKIRDAIDVIGLKRLKNLVVSVGYQLHFANSALAEIAEFNLHTARVASEIAFHLPQINEDEAYLAGLFHNAGALLFAARFDNYDEVFANSLGAAYTAPKIEKMHFSSSHTVAGLLVAHKWRLDNVFNQVILMHHQANLSTIQNDKARTLVAIVQLAMMLVVEVIYPHQYCEEAFGMMCNSQEELMFEDSLVNELRDELIAYS